MPSDRGRCGAHGVCGAEGRVILLRTDRDVRGTLETSEAAGPHDTVIAPTESNASRSEHLVRRGPGDTTLSSKRRTLHAWNPRGDGPRDTMPHGHGRARQTLEIDEATTPRNTSPPRPGQTCCARNSRRGGPALHSAVPTGMDAASSVLHSQGWLSARNAWGDEPSRHHAVPTGTALAYRNPRGRGPVRYAPAEQECTLCDRNRRRGEPSQYRALPTGTDVKRSEAALKDWLGIQPTRMGASLRRSGREWLRCAR